MPASREQAVEIARRLGLRGSTAELAGRLAPTTESGLPIPPDVPAPKDSTASGRDQRLEFLRARGFELPYVAGERREGT